ncbi:outer membrane lipoprotein carrier protein LolA [Pasteurella atlantica]|uniref:LolA family protein n=1 Tax=Pasteurellaceae TaxID=712 RepID=UPI002766F9F0|nr:outer membrane lipoprotein carrier protein LolA [Pasteurella atlantica]MDP8033772.1 outer membrane lipoprotein carrier protein LolA [Pasteurella atlantica]MDP8035707.1 outer membrane lipoprotein carrier protein LolA [Pasteurella atlantica]MDP8037612.1 outer membrane lipoprotein carrier protein LolA [Pasteurella atlantica]MDP8048007.1 outer membrane lipoprotein carrier protein LolA [Pasteurella atlantica]MDP8049962.1 outer membrane lipoprotein carrier protein LolA [Pasteurella atlantica]
MKKYFTLFLLFISPLTLAITQQELISQLQKPQNVQGNFVQQRFLKALKNPIQTSGQFTLVAKKGLLWQMKKPFENNLRVTSKGIMQYNGTEWVGNNNLAQQQQIQLFLGLLSGDISTLKQQFDLKLTGKKSAWQLDLIPNAFLMKQIFKTIQLQGNDVVTQIILDEKQGDKTVIQFENIQINTPLSSFTQQALN